mmetsp:Transcript_29291/g.63099  ORF Transcript_29291/g.63099 Transcript_29291/m.63099 type:complete len:237 (+) Transcript_29291:42-752(+)
MGSSEEPCEEAMQALRFKALRGVHHAECNRRQIEGQQHGQHDGQQVHSLVGQHVRPTYAHDRSLGALTCPISLDDALALGAVVGGLHRSAQQAVHQRAQQSAQQRIHQHRVLRAAAGHQRRPCEEHAADEQPPRGAGQRAHTRHASVCSPRHLAPEEGRHQAWVIRRKNPQLARPRVRVCCAIVGDVGCPQVRCQGGLLQAKAGDLHPDVVLTGSGKGHALVLAAQQVEGNRHHGG